MGEVERTVETDELRADQATIRAELYGGMMDAYAGGDAANVGRRVVLGPNFTRSARQFGRSYQDALALLREHGPPALIGPPLTVVAHSAGEVRDEIREEAIVSILGTSDDQVGEMDLFLASKPDQMSPDGKEHVIRTLSRIRDIGQEIHDRGGLAAMQAIFYIMTNFIVGNDRDRAKFTALKRFWRGIGNWEY